MKNGILSGLERGLRVGTVLGFPMYMGTGCVYSIVNGDHVQAANARDLEQKILETQDRQRRVAHRSFMLVGQPA